MAAASDSKSDGGNLVPVRVRLPASLAGAKAVNLLREDSQLFFSQTKTFQEIHYPFLTKSAIID